MSLSTTSIKRPVLTIVMNLALVLFGIIGFTYLGVREFPSIDPAQISVRTNYTGANADIIESQSTEPLEKAINAIDGIRNITSSSNQGSSNITIEFNLDKIWRKLPMMFGTKCRKPFAVCRKISMHHQ